MSFREKYEKEDENTGKKGKKYSSFWEKLIKG
jgi:hypothetical protein